MAFQPDILITTPDGRVMVIEAKVVMTDLPHTEQALKQYMVGMQYPFGLLITPEKGWVYRDLYSSLSPEALHSIQSRCKPVDGPGIHRYIRWAEENGQLDKRQAEDAHQLAHKYIQSISKELSAIPSVLKEVAALMRSDVCF
ncbi:MAG: hypothetical protein JO340_04630 [Acidobacteriaceae bacterium]|nr:hypothetical protein [Acidobacteriaceae bacterium]